MSQPVLRAAALALLLLLAARPGVAQTSPSADETLRVLLADEWATRMQDDPLYATQSGVRDYDDRLPAVSPQDYARRDAQDAE